MTAQTCEVPHCTRLAHRHRGMNGTLTVCDDHWAAYLDWRRAVQAHETQAGG